MSKPNQKGFTIIELLIAMSIFTVLLLVLTGAVVQIGRLYYKGLTMSRTQEAARTVMDDLSRAIQYTPGIVKTTLTPAGNSQGVCVGSRRYSFVPGRKLDKDVSGRSLVADQDLSGCTAAQNLSSATAGNELLADKMRVSQLRIQSSVEDPTLAPQAYRVTVRIVYGDDDLMCSPSVTVTTDGAHCSNGSGSISAALLSSSRDLQCKNIKSGTQFCAVAELSTIVERRL